MRNELAQSRLGVGPCAAGRVPEVELDARRRRNDVGGDAALDPDRAHDLAKDEPVELDVERLEPDELLEAAHELVDRVHARPRAARSARSRRGT